MEPACRPDLLACHETLSAALGDAMGCGDEWIGVATQETGFEWRGLA